MMNFIQGLRPYAPKGSYPRSWLSLALRLGLGGLYAVTGALKIAEPTAFATEIHNYQLFPALAPLLAASLPAVELVLAAALLVGPRPWARAGGLASAALMLVFTVAVTSVVVRGINVSCGCFGAGSGPVTVLTVLRDLALLAASVAVFALTDDAPSRATPRPA